MSKIKSENIDDSSLIPELLSLLKKSVKGIIEFFEQQLKNIEISDGLSLLNLLKPFGKFLGQLLLFFKFFRLFKEAVELGNRLGKGCDLIYIPVNHPEAGHFRTGSIKNFPIKIPGNQVYILVGNQLFFVDKHEKCCIKWHITEDLKRELFFQQTQAWLAKYFLKKERQKVKAKEEENTLEEIKIIGLSKKRLALIQALTDHKRPEEKIKGISKPLFALVGGSSLFLNTVNNLLKLGLFIASVAVFNGVIPEAISQVVSVAFFNISFLFIGIHIVKTFSKYLNEKDWEKREIFRARLFQQTLELLVPLAVIILAGLVWLGITTPIFSAFITVGFLGLPFFQNIFRSIDHVVAFQNMDAQKTKKVLKKLLKLVTSALSLLTSGYVFAKALNGVVIEVGMHLIDLGQLAFNSAGFIFTAFTVVCCLVELGKSIFMLAKNVKQLSIENSFSIRNALQQEVVSHIFDMVFSSGMLCIALLGFWGVINPFVGVAMIASFFLGNLVINKFFSDWTGVVSGWLFSENAPRNVAESAGMSEINGINLPNSSNHVEVEKKQDDKLELSKHPFAFFEYGSKSPRGPLSPKGSQDVQKISVGEGDRSSPFQPGYSFNSFDVTS